MRILDLEYSADLVKLNNNFSDFLFQAFKRYITLKSSRDKVDDDLRVLQQQLQQDTDALIENAQAIRVSKFKNMRDSQIKRNVDVKVNNLFFIFYHNYYYFSFFCDQTLYFLFHHSTFAFILTHFFTISLRLFRRYMTSTN